MNCIVKLGVEFTNTDIVPFFQVNKDNRIRFVMDNFINHKAKLLGEIVNDIFGEDSIKTFFISGYILQNNKRISLKTGLGKILKISNWKEILYKKSADDDHTVIFGEIDKLNREHVITYCKKIAHGKLKESYIIFYTDDFLLYVNSDVVDIVSPDIKKIYNLKTKYNNVFDKYYE